MKKIRLSVSKYLITALAAFALILWAMPILLSLIRQFGIAGDFPMPSSFIP